MTQSTTPPPILDQEYYWDFITFSVQDHLFRVPRYRFVNDSESFANEYSLDLKGTGSENEYNVVDSQLNAVKLDVSANDFRNFLQVLYPKEIQCNSTLSRDEWLAVLDISSKWFFNGIRKLAIGELTLLNVDFGPIDKVQLGRKYGVEEWLLNGFQEFVEREHIITVNDAKKITCDTAIELYTIREKRIRSLSPWNDDVIDVDDLIRTAFATEFESIQSAQPQFLTMQEKEELSREQARIKREAKEKAEREVEALRLKSIAAEEEERIAKLTLELEERRKTIKSLEFSEETIDIPPPSPAEFQPQAPSSIVRPSAKGPVSNSFRGVWGRKAAKVDSGMAVSSGKKHEIRVPVISPIRISPVGSTVALEEARSMPPSPSASIGTMSAVSRISAYHPEQIYSKNQMSRTPSRDDETL